MMKSITISTEDHQIEISDESDYLSICCGLNGEIQAGYMLDIIETMLLRKYIDTWIKNRNENDDINNCKK